MRKGLTELVFIIDRSGSMAGLESDTIGGFNAMIEKQKKADGTAYVSTVLFSTDCKVIHDRVGLHKVAPMTDEDYLVGGCTALLDAIGKAIHHIGNVHKYAREEDRPEHTLFVITTDGMENASHDYTAAQIKQKAASEIEMEKKKALNDAKNEISGLAMAIAGKVVARELNSADQEQMIDRFIDELGGAV